MKLLFLNAVVKVPNELGEQRIEEAIKNKKGGKSDGYGRTMQWYIENEIRPPKDLEEDDSPEMDEDGNVFLTEDQLNYEFLDFTIPIKHFFSAKDDLEIGCIIKDTLGGEHHVVQTADDLYMYIDFMQRSFWQKIKDKVKYRYRKYFVKKEEILDSKIN